MVFPYAICNEMFADRPLPHVLETVARMGYAGIEIAPFTLLPDQSLVDVRSVSPYRRTEVRRQACDAGLKITGLHWLLAKTAGFHLTSADGACRRRTAAYLVALAELCADLGGQVLVLGSPQQRSLATGVSRADGWQYAEEVLCAVMPTCEALGVVLALEPLGPDETNFLNTAAESVALAQRVASSNCRIVLDVKAMSSERTPIPKIILRTTPGWLIFMPTIRICWAPAWDRRTSGPFWPPSTTPVTMAGYRSKFFATSRVPSTSPAAASPI